PMSQLHFNARATTPISTLSLHDALPIFTPLIKNATITSRVKSVHGIFRKVYIKGKSFEEIYDIYAVRIIVDTMIDCYNALGIVQDRKSTRLNSSHVSISYAVFCLKKKT